MQQRRGRAWYFFSDDLPPDGDLMVPILNEYGLGIAVVPNRGIDQEALDELNRIADHVLGVGIAHLNVGPRLLAS